jgi:Mn-dependent DtxR family transcriptional regulator
VPPLGGGMEIIMSYIKHKSEESLEDYLETILILSKRLPAVRSIDIAHELSFSKPSVSIAMKNLRNNDYITVSEEGHISLTPSGKEIAESVYEKHTLLSDWLIYLGVDPETAVADACKMEHDISPESFQAIKKHVRSIM